MCSLSWEKEIGETNQSSWVVVLVQGGERFVGCFAMVMCDYCTCSEVPFEYVKFFLEQVSGAKGKRKGDHLRAFREKYINRSSDDIFEIYRLLLPQVRILRILDCEVELVGVV